MPENELTLTEVIEHLQAYQDLLLEQDAGDAHIKAIELVDAGDHVRIVLLALAKDGREITLWARDA